MSGRGRGRGSNPGIPAGIRPPRRSVRINPPQPPEMKEKEKISEVKSDMEGDEYELSAEEMAALDDYERMDNFRARIGEVPQRPMVGRGRNAKIELLPTPADFEPAPDRVGTAFNSVGRARGDKLILDRRAKANLFDPDRERKAIAAKARGNAGLLRFRNAVIRWGESNGYKLKPTGEQRGIFREWRKLSAGQKEAALASAGYKKPEPRKPTPAEIAAAKQRAQVRKVDKAGAGFMTNNQIQRAEIAKATYPAAVAEFKRKYGREKPNPHGGRSMSVQEKSDLKAFMQIWQGMIKAKYVRGAPESKEERMRVLYEQYSVVIDPSIFRSFKALRIPKTSQVLNNLAAYVLARKERFSKKMSLGFYGEGTYPFLGAAALRAAYADNVIAKRQQKSTKTTTTGLKSAFKKDLITRGQLVQGNPPNKATGTKGTGDYYVITAKVKGDPNKTTQRIVLTTEGNRKVDAAIRANPKYGAM